MSFYYLSFCDPNKPKGTQFLGATCVEAEDEKDALAVATRLGTNPGGEAAISELRFGSWEALPLEAHKYFNTFVPREIAMAEAGTQEQQDHFNRTAIRICQDCNS